MAEKIQRLTLLQRIDLALAARASRRGTAEAWTEGWQQPWQQPDRETDATWIANLLRLRDIQVDESDVRAVLRGGNGRLVPGGQELYLTRGAMRVLAAMRERAATGQLPEGCSLWQLFRTLTDGVRRFRNNTVRRDVPWDAVARVPYPAPDAVPGMLQDFAPALCYGEPKRAFAATHPVRQAFRVLWRFGRLAPFPDFNLVLAFLAMETFLLAKGYPMLVPEPADRELLTGLIAGGPPLRVLRLERRLAELAERLAER